MQLNRNTKGIVGSVTRSNISGTDAQKVKKEIQEDIKRGEGAMTSREAGAMRD
jgi:hypothetical protein